MTFSKAFEHAMGVLDDLREAGFAIIPAAPSKAMIEAGKACSGLDAATVEKIFRAMVHAAAKE